MAEPTTPTETLEETMAAIARAANDTRVSDAERELTETLASIQSYARMANALVFSPRAHPAHDRIVHERARVAVERISALAVRAKAISAEFLSDVD
ncbi:hypothetical protein [Gordonia sp. CPCC 205333]|uniref:hypothetical protein n=1 Tax=Gordonia sp. CPCC 205333 TaxID=3140790 RepID=UPI003AF3B95D